VLLDDPQYLEAYRVLATHVLKTVADTDARITTVFRLAEHCNRLAGRERMPRVIIDKPPSAELRPNQLDTDSLPPYEVLDPILKAYVEEDRSSAEIVDMGFDEQLVGRVVRMVDTNEDKRRQAAQSKITPRRWT
jgi:NAD+ synthase (glutamine-hydrolysing)